jgi:acyl carrier protein
MSPTPEQIIETIRDEIDWPMRHPALPELTADTTLDQHWFGPVDRVCVQMRLDEVFGIEIPCADAEAWASVGDIVASVVALAGVPA